MKESWRNGAKRANFLIDDDVINVETLVGDNLYPQRGKHYCLPEDRDRRIPLCVFQLSRSRLTRQCRLSVRHGQSTTSHGIGFPNPTIPPSFHVCHGLKEQESAGIFRESPPPPEGLLEAAAAETKTKRSHQQLGSNNLLVFISILEISPKLLGILPLLDISSWIRFFGIGWVTWLEPGRIAGDSKKERARSRTSLPPHLPTKSPEDIRFKLTRPDMYP